MTKIVSFINRKGGVGKTTITVNLAGYIAAENAKKVLVIDLDPQASASIWLMTQDRYIKNVVENDRPKNSAYQIFADAMNNQNHFTKEKSIQYAVVRDASGKPQITNLDLIAADSKLDNVEREIVNYNDLRVSILYDTLKKKVLENDYDYIFIDCPPNMNTITRNAIFASDVFIIPIISDQLSIQGFPELINTVKEVLDISAKRREDKTAAYCGGLIISHYSSTNSNKTTLSYLETTLQSFVSRGVLDDRTKIFHTFIKYLTGIPECQSTECILATSKKRVQSQTEFSALAKEFIEHIN